MPRFKWSEEYMKHRKNTKKTKINLKEIAFKTIAKLKIHSFSFTNIIF